MGRQTTNYFVRNTRYIDTSVSVSIEKDTSQFKEQQMHSRPTERKEEEKNMNNNEIKSQVDPRQLMTSSASAKAKTATGGGRLRVVH